MKYDIDIDSYIGYPITKQWVRSKLDACKGKPCAVRINSYGGDVQHALDIFQQFRDHGNVTAYIYGMTASAATILAMGAQKVVMSKYALLLIHKCLGFVDNWGMYNADDLQRLIEELQGEKASQDNIDGVIATIYATRADKPVETIAETMAKGLWLTADECLSLGLIDQIIEEGEKPKMTNAISEHFAACGIPVPDIAGSLRTIQDGDRESDTACPSSLASIITGLRKLFRMSTQAEDAPAGESDKNPDVFQNSSTSNLSTVMPTKLTNLVACAALAALFSDETRFSDIGSMNLSEEDLSLLDSTVGELSSQIRDLTAERDNLIAERDSLKAQVDALNKQDGDTTSGIPGSEQEATDGLLATMARADEAYNLLG